MDYGKKLYAQFDLYERARDMLRKEGKSEEEIREILSQLVESFIRIEEEAQA